MTDKIQRPRLIIISAEAAHYGKFLGGHGTYVYSMIDVFKQGYDVELIVAGFKGQHAEEQRDGITVRRIFTRCSQKYENFQELLSAEPHSVDSLCLDFNNGVQAYCSQIHQGLGDSIVYLNHGWCEGLLARQMKKLGFKKVVITFHWLRIQRYLRALFSPAYIDIAYDLKSIGRLSRWILRAVVSKIWRDEVSLTRCIRRFYSLGMQRVLPLKIRLYYESEVLSCVYADAITVLSQDMQRYLLGLIAHDIKSKVEVIYNGVGNSYCEESDQGFKEKMGKRFSLVKAGPVLLFVGRLDPMKGIEYLIQALHYMELHMPHRVGQCTLLIVGESYGIYKESYLPYLQSLAGQCRQARVVFTGPLYGPEQLAAYDISDAVILPSVYEPFGLVALEAMARGKPVIVSEFCGVSEIVQSEFGRVVAYKEVGRRAHALAGAIDETLSQDPALMAAAAKRAVQRYTAANTAAALRRSCFV